MEPREAEVIILMAGYAARDNFRACACECAMDESCYSCDDCSDRDPECAC